MLHKLGNNEGFVLQRDNPAVDIDLTEIVKKSERTTITNVSNKIKPNIYTIINSDLTDIEIEMELLDGNQYGDYIIEVSRNKIPNAQSIAFLGDITWEGNNIPDITDFTDLGYDYWLVTIENSHLGSYKRYWNGETHNYDNEYFTFKALESGTFTFTMSTILGTDVVPYMSYSVDGGDTWTRTNNVDNETVVVTTPTIKAGQSVIWKSEAVQFITNTNPYPGSPTYGYGHFASSGKFNVSGNIMSLMYGDDFVGETQLKPLITTGAEAGSFSGILSDSKVISAYNLILPATTLTQYCYCQMFENCRNLVETPSLIATTLELDCYSHMFRDCTSLTTAPELPATTLADFCYSYMFYGCTNLNYIKAMFTTTPSTTYTNNWVYNVASTGTFVKNSTATWTTTGVHGVPSGWTVQTASS